MTKALITDFSRVLLFPKDKSYSGSLNDLHRKLSSQLNYKLFNHFELNDELLDYYKSLTEKLDLYVFTSESIQDAPELQPLIKPIFREIFSAMKMNINKKDEIAYKKLVAIVNLEPNEVVYIDDNEANIEAARKAGLQTTLFKDNDQLKTRLDAMLEVNS